MNFETYFDWAATAPIDDDILNKSLNIAIDFGGNPSSVHAEGVKAKQKLDEIRKSCAISLGVKAEQIYFTSGGTESDYLPLLSLMQGPVRGNILVSSIEHDAIAAQAQMMKHCGFSVTEIPCTKEGIITPKAVIDKIQDDTQFISVMAVNNETGAIQPIYEISDAISAHCAGKRRPRFHVDAVQAIGKIPLNLAYKGIDSLAISAHKIRGPRGVGILYMEKRTEPFLRAGGQEEGIRSGTENIMGTWALSKVLEKYVSQATKSIASKTEENDFMSLFNNQVEQTADLINKLKTIKGCQIIPKNRGKNPKSKKYSPWILQVSFANIPGQVMVRALSEKGFYISTGSACSSRKNNRPVLLAMGIDKETATNAVRISFGNTSTKKGINALFEAIKEIANFFN
ncbi:MAG: cysteine desulfurase [Treponema sp. CETP13]|nr:MAG: cysteine desulfurase [Treponema sp. CETP13]